MQPEDQSIEHQSKSGDEKAPFPMKNRTGDEYKFNQQGSEKENSTSKKPLTTGSVITASDHISQLETEINVRWNQVVHKEKGQAMEQPTAEPRQKSSSDSDK